MNVRELMQLLAACDPEATVLTWDPKEDSDSTQVFVSTPGAPARTDVLVASFAIGPAVQRPQAEGLEAWLQQEAKRVAAAWQARAAADPRLVHGKGHTQQQLADGPYALPVGDLMTATKIDDPPGAGIYYRTDTVVRLLQEARRDERLKCAQLCEDNSAKWDRIGGDGGASLECADAIRRA